MDKEEVKKHQREVLEKRKKQGEKERFIRSPFGFDVQVNKNVFGPMGTDTKLIGEELKKLDLTGKRLLEMTTGTGVLSTLAGLQGATGLAFDINPLAVKNARENFTLHEVDFEAKESNAFSSIDSSSSPNKRFDIIICNPPYLDGDIEDLIEHAFKGAQSLMEEIFSKGSNYLEPDSYMLVTWAEWADEDIYIKPAEANGWKRETLAKKASDDGKRTYCLDRWTK